MGQSQSTKACSPPRNLNKQIINASKEVSSAKRTTSSNSKITLIKAPDLRGSNVTREQIKKLLNARSEDGILITQLIVSLTCPLGKMRMIHPCRASTCSHIQCFDASVYTQWNCAKPTWKCPVCNNPASHRDLFIDEYFTEILKSNKLLPGVNNIELLKDGSWKNVVDKKLPTHEVDKIESLTKKMEKIDLARTALPKSVSQKEVVVIDLTSSTDDDSTLPSRKLSSRKICKDIFEIRGRKWAESRRKFFDPEIITIDSE